MKVSFVQNKSKSKSQTTSQSKTKSESKSKSKQDQGTDAVDGDGDDTDVDPVDPAALDAGNQLESKWNSWQTKINALNTLIKHVPLPSVIIKKFDRSQCTPGEDLFVCKTDHLSE
jgi:hypothetical protein